ncbi:unnamed protein product [Polarella glacialis]|uniref:Uncharacterized protein n=1 Tax=Polarella glacialis TaxID=89957 RepID=A0A813LXJ0_POLGL|nr:unnamed protein product [Polarella glacialis]
MSGNAIVIVLFLALSAVLMQASSVPSMSEEITTNLNNNNIADLPLSKDDECHLENNHNDTVADGTACSFNALQTKGRKVNNNDYNNNHYGTSIQGCGPCSHHEEKITEPWKTCAAKENRCCHSCGVWSAVNARPHHGTGGCVNLKDKVAPTAPCGGMEGITASTSADFDSLWQCASKKTRASPGMALIVNPWLARTQHHMHVVVKPLDDRGHALARRKSRLAGLVAVGTQHTLAARTRKQSCTDLCRLSSAKSSPWPLAAGWGN